ncbi:Panacea domain-containing protein [Cellulomonas sp. GbtcB1]|uniref:Panacea domain-containing protein n=1 Tax=Cellulomonas sp. GbtcB1 TaxID=2824746 RepID=UPI001C30F749|nr:type II toxin-antitoxin system antitoxin SocA domain-containing protein [Cellulomonas sp. GbtcB1]
MATIDDVAAYVVDHFDSSISTMKLQKLCYMAQGWSLALRGRELFPENFEAWRNGPVSRDLFRGHRREYSVGRWLPGDSSSLTRDERIVCDAVLNNYGALSGLQLSELTHRPGTPWSKTRHEAGVPDGASCDRVIPKSRIQEHFRTALLSAKD